MAAVDRRELASRALAGYVHGPAAATEATALALEKTGDARAVLLVEGISDQIAVETAAAGRGRDLAAERVVVVPIGGAHAIARFVTRFGPHVRVAGLYDVREEPVIRRGLGAPHTDLEQLGFFVCVQDLEDELIRAVGTDEVEALFAAQGELKAFRSMQNQPAWRDHEPVAQMRRFLSGAARRKLRYARLLVELSLRRGTLARPLDALLTHVSP